jgi:NAD(P)H-hydrate repair Nnr-like enzyme with NAD(P)H-hydrate dehydratase domain
MTTAVDIESRLLRRMPLPLPGGEVDKNSRGRVLLVGGSHRVPGAILLSGTAVLRSGAGKVQVACPRSLALPLGIAIPEAGLCALDEDADGEPLASSALSLIELASNSHAVLIGPGVMVLKGATTFIASPTGAAFRYDEGVVGLATAGSGDVLAGLIGGLAARGCDPVQAAIWGVFLHAQAGQQLSRTRGALGFLARELPTEVPALLESFRVPAGK